MAQRIGNNVFQVVLRYETDGFVKDYFKAIVDTNPVISSNEKTNIVLNQPLEFDINKELYGNVLFQNGVFRRIKNYHKLTPYSAIITTTDKKKAKYFSDFLPGFCVLSDAGMRDAAFHAIQACVPDFTLLPVRIGTCKIFNTSESTSYVISANEKFRNGDIFNYDISIFNEDLQLIEKWNDVEFKLLHTTKKYRMPTLLLKNVLERKLDEVNGIKGYCRIQFNKDSSDIIIKRADGRPLLLKNGVNYSNSNSSGIEVVVKSELSTACDVEVVELKTDSEWCKLLGDTKFNIAKIIKSETGESISEASTRVWGAIECLRKAGNSLFDSFAFSGIENGTIYFTSGDKTIVSFKCRVISNPSESIFSILTTK